MNGRQQPTPPRVLARTLHVGQKLEAALDALPEGRGLSTDTKHWLVKMAVEELLRYHAVCSELQSVKSRRSVPRAHAQKSIDQFISAAKRLKKSVNSMPLAAVQSIISQSGVPPFATLGLSLNIVLADAVKAIPPEATINRGSLASDLAQHAAGTFELFTGRKATPGRDRGSGEPNAFERFLAAVFDALSVNASAEFEAKKLRRREKNKLK